MKLAVIKVKKIKNRFRFAISLFCDKSTLSPRIAIILANINSFFDNMSSNSQVFVCTFILIAVNHQIVDILTFFERRTPSPEGVVCVFSYWKSI
jgi:hypothetical protein